MRSIFMECGAASRTVLPVGLKVCILAVLLAGTYCRRLVRSERVVGGGSLGVPEPVQSQDRYRRSHHKYQPYASFRGSFFYDDFAQTFIR